MNSEFKDHPQNMIAIILIGKKDFGRCPIASNLPTTLWPVLDKTALHRLLDSLSEQGLKQAIICSYDDPTSLKESLKNYHGMQLEFLEEKLPMGTAGCIRYAIEQSQVTIRPNDLLVIFQGSMVNQVDIQLLIEPHNHHHSTMTVALNPNVSEYKPSSEAAGVYICNPNIMDFIPNDGYCDIKETLIPELIRSGKHIDIVRLPYALGNFREKESYLAAMSDYLKRKSLESNENVWIDPSATVHPNAKIVGPAVIMNNAIIEENAIILGPAIIHEKTQIKQQSLVDHSIVWDNTIISDNCHLERCLIDKNVTLPVNTLAQDKAILCPRPSLIQNLTMVLHKNLWIGFTLLIIAVSFSYSKIIQDLFHIWFDNDEYACGALVPIIAGVVFWKRRHQIVLHQYKPILLWGCLALLLVQGLRFYGLWTWLQSLERISFVLSIIVLFWMFMGWKAFKTVLTIMLFLFLMLPLPNSIQKTITTPLQTWATESSIFTLEMIGYDVNNQGNIIHLRSNMQEEYTSVAIAEACNGLRMVTAFFVVCGLVTLIYKGPFWHKAVGMLSCIPIALLCNTIRLTLTAIMFTYLEGPDWEKWFHDFGGFAMMPLAILFIVLEFQFLNKLILTEPKNQDQILVRKEALS